MSISIFAKKTSRGRGNRLQRVSSMIRGVQVAEQIGAKLNPEEGYENDVCIYVKPHVPKGFDWKFDIGILTGEGISSPVIQVLFAC